MRADNLRVERAAVAATELSLARCAADLLAYQADPFRVARIQVKGCNRRPQGFQQYSTIPIIMSYVLDPLGAADVILLTGDQAWNLPADYIAEGGKASGYDPGESVGCCTRCSAGTRQRLSGGWSSSTSPPSPRLSRLWTPGRTRSGLMLARRA